MGTDKEKIRFSSGPGWQFESMTFCRDPERSAEFRLVDRSGRRLYLDLRGLRSPETMIRVLYEFDDFEIVETPPSTPYVEFGRFLCRFHLDDDKYETVVDGFEAYEGGTEPSPKDGQGKPSSQ